LNHDIRVAAAALTASWLFFGVAKINLLSLTAYLLTIAVFGSFLYNNLAGILKRQGLANGE
jgi:hypothetical protein